MTARDATWRALRVLVAALGLMCAFGAASALAAGPFTVDSTIDAVDPGGCVTAGVRCTLRDAVIAANAAGGSSTIILQAQTYNLTILPNPSSNDDATTGDLNVTANVTINGATNGGATTIIDGGGTAAVPTDRVFRVESGAILTLSTMTIQHGHPAGGAAFPMSDGGGILALGALKLTDATVQDNFVSSSSDQRSGAGAGIAQGASVALALSRVNVLNNQVIVASGKLGGGGGLLLAGGAPGSVTIVDSNISGNTAAGPGGGVYSTPSANNSAVTITGTTISGNHAQLPPNNDPLRPHAFGGGIASDGAIPVTLANDTITGNTADQAGGGIFDDGASIYTITDTSIVSNAAVGGFTSSGGDSRGGGGIAADGGTPNPGWILNRDLIALNTAGDGNHPNVPGGGIDEDGGDTFTVTNSTIFNNTATGIGGGYESNGGGTHKLTNDTIDSNVAGSGSGGNIDNSGGAAFTLANTIVAHGFPANCANPNGSALPISHDHNLETTNTCGFGGSDLINTDPKLAGLGINGGPTLTLALLPGSPAIDAGDNAQCPPTDQRGVSRSENPVCDVGAFELRHTLTVTNNQDSGAGSLRDAIDSSDSGSTIVFSPALNGQTIRLTAGLVITHSLTIAGPGASQLTIDGGHNVTLFDVEAGQAADSVTISGLTLTGGAFSSSVTNGGGGAIFANTLHDLTLNGDTITGNRATVDNANHGGGGGVYANGTTLTITNSTITNNNVTITNAHGGGHGGGGIFSNSGTTIVNGSVVSNNTVNQMLPSSSNGDGGGGIYDRAGNLTLTNTTVANNSSTVTGGGANGGGGVYEDGDTLTITGSTINANTFTLISGATGSSGGGGVYSNGGTTTVTTSSIDDNTETVTDSGSIGGADGGGGLYSDSGDLSVISTTIANNTASVTSPGGSNGGGAVYDQGTNTTYLNSTLSGNSITVNSQGTTQNGGGAIHGFGNAQGRTAISASTIAGNTINQPGGAIFDQLGTFTLKSAVVSGNSPKNCDGAGPFTSAGNNLESANTCGFTAAGDLINTDPKLGPLQNNGGPTPTQALPANSPAVDGGSCTDVSGAPIATDQRGTARPQPTGGKCDIGAFELEQAAQPKPPPPPPSSAPSAHTSSPPSKSSTGATFSGDVNPQGQPTTYFFEYGLDPSLRPPGSSTALYDQSTAPQTLPADSSTHTVSAPVSGLVPNARYHVRLVARNATGTTFGPDQTFTTPAGPPPPPPVLGQSQNAKPVSGHLFTVINGQEVPLTSTQHLPSGTVLDARNGSLELFTAPAHGHKLQTGVFSGAIFKVTEARNGVTTLTLVEGAFKGAPTYASCRSHGAPDAHASRLSSRILQSLHSRASGRFTTRGRYAAGTVRGTQWTTTDRCDGTLIAVQVHSVLVSDFVKHINVLVRAGHNYLARAKG